MENKPVGFYHDKNGEYYLDPFGNKITPNTAGGKKL